MPSVLLCPTCRETYEVAPSHLDHYWDRDAFFPPHVCPGPPPPTILHPVAGESDFLKDQRMRREIQATFGLAPYTVPWSVGQGDPMPAAERARVRALFPPARCVFDKPVMDDVDHDYEAQIHESPGTARRVKARKAKKTRPICGSVNPADVGDVCQRSPRHVGNCRTCHDFADLGRHWASPAKWPTPKKPEPALPGPGECWERDSHPLNHAAIFATYPAGPPDNRCRTRSPDGVRYLCLRPKHTDGLHVGHGCVDQVAAIWRDPAPEAPAGPGPQTGAPLLFGREMEDRNGGDRTIGEGTFPKSPDGVWFWATTGYSDGGEIGYDIRCLLADCEEWKASPDTHQGLTRAEAEAALLQAAVEDEAVRTGLEGLGVEMTWPLHGLGSSTPTGANWTDENGDRQRWEAKR